LNSDGQIIADRVVIGDITTVFGTVNSNVESEQFQLNARCPFSELKDDGITVTVSEDTIILIDGIEAGPDQIQSGQKACVAGKYNEETHVLQAIAIFLKAPRIVGKLTALETTNDGNLLTISQGVKETTLILPEYVTPMIQGGDELTVQELTNLIACEPPLVQATIDRMLTDETHAQAITLKVLPQMIEVTVAEVDIESRTITTDEGQTIVVAEDAVQLHTFSEQTQSDLADIQEGDELMIAAIKICEPADYHATMLLKWGPCELPCMPQFESVKITVSELSDNIITATDGTVIEVTEETIMIDNSQHQFGELSLEEISTGDTLICDVLKPCEENTSTQALVIIKVDPSADDTSGNIDIGDICMPKLEQIDTAVDSIADGSITTTDGQTIQVPEETPIIMETEIGMEDVELTALKAGVQIKIATLHFCKNESLTAIWIVVSLSQK
jgi:hypothetical protein